jgi:UDP-N-acetylmuramate dehydrogenase
MSEIPSSVGGAVFGNIAAYGQQTSDTLAWVDVYDTDSQQIERLEKSDIRFAYRQSSLQDEPHRKILRAGFQLSHTPLHTLKYDSALAIAEEQHRDINNQQELRDVIIETRRRAGSLYHPDDSNAERTAGSFFKNPMVSVEQAHELASFDETGKTIERILNQSKVHGGNAQRASAAHVLFAAGFHRGQTWGNVRLHNQHVLKIETLPGATAQEVCDVSRHIIDTVKQKLGIDIEAEVKFLGEF